MPTRANELAYAAAKLRVCVDHAHTARRRLKECVPADPFA